MLEIKIEPNANTVYLTGELDTQTLHTIWSKEQKLFKTAKNIDVSALIRVDSPGLAMLVYFCNKYSVKLLGITAQLQALIELYDLSSVIGE